MPLPIRFQIEEHEVLDSTQASMRARVRAGDTVDGLVLRAVRQERGAGRPGRRWVSEAGGSWQTLAVRRPPAGSPARARLAAGTAAVAVAVGVAEVLGEYGARARVKWPNDLLYRERKLAGVLVEVVGEHLLVGVGVNVANRPPEGGIGLRGWDVAAVHGAVLAGVQRGLDLLVDGQALPPRFAALDALAGRHVEVRAGDVTHAGVARGIDDGGCLLLAGAGATARCCSGTVRAIDGRTRAP